MPFMRFTLTLLLIITIRGTAQDTKELTVSVNTTDKEEFTITGKIDGIGNSKVLLGNKPNGYSGAFKVRYFDSCMSNNDHFTFKGRVNEPGFYSIEVPGKARGWVYFILENKEIKIVGSKDSLYRSAVTGSPQSDIYFRYKREIHGPFVRKSWVIHDIIDSLRKVKDTVEIKRLENEVLDPYEKEWQANLYRFIEANPTNFGSLAELNDPSIPIDSVRKYFKKLSNALQQSTEGRKLKYRLFDYEQLIVLKKPIPDFTMADTAQCNWNISDFRGKYVLIDFWASWCGPCLDELPAVKKIDSLYRGKGLQVLGISLDTKRHLWTKAIIKNNITWINLSDLEGADGKLATLLNITAIPSKFLLDTEGNIVLKEASLADIEQFLEERL